MPLKLFSIAIGSILAITAAAQDFYDMPAELIWSKDVPLSWDFYQARAPEEPLTAVFSSTGIRFKWSEESDLVSFTVYTIFDESESWIIHENKSPELLNHEQIHFNITELYARKIRKALTEVRSHRNLQSIKLKMRAVFKKQLKQEKRTQEKYDAATDYSKNAAEQAEWTMTINSELEELKNYSEPVFRFQRTAVKK